MILAPQPRFRFYNGIRNYRLVLRDVTLGRVFKGDAVRETERCIAEWLDVGQVILTPQGRYGIYLGVSATIRPGQQVIMSPYTLYDVVNMVVAAGGVPCFADTDPRTCNISPHEVERLIDKKTGAVLVTHLHGLSAPLDHIGKICDDYGVPLLEDACQAFGARYKGRRMGTIGEMGFFSFGRAKNVNAFLGGAIATNKRQKADLIRQHLSKLAHENASRLLKRIGHCALGQALTSPLVFSMLTYWVFRYGALKEVEAVTRQFNTELNPVLRKSVPEHYERQISQMQARIIRDQIDSVDCNSQQRLDIAKLYYQGLKDISDIILPPMVDDLSHIYLNFAIQVPDRKKLQRYMMENGRDVVIQHLGNTADLECFAQYFRDCPNARRTASSVLLLPTYPGYLPSEAQKNVDVVRRFFCSPKKRVYSWPFETAGKREDAGVNLRSLPLLRSPEAFRPSAISLGVSRK